jgi:uncharacterized OB-fold protein
MGGHVNKPDSEVDDSTIPVQPGLFEYSLKEGQSNSLLGNRCQSCGKAFFPKRLICPHCFVDGSLQDVRLPRRGIIYASTVVHIISPAGIKAPYAYGYVDLHEDGPRVFALFSGEDLASFSPGRDVEVIIEPIRQDSQRKTIIGYKFRLLD